MSLQDLSNSKKTALYTSLVRSGLIHTMTNENTSRYGAGKLDILNDLEQNYPGLMETDPDKIESIVVTTKAVAPQPTTPTSSNPKVYTGAMDYSKAQGLAVNEDTVPGSDLSTEVNNNPPGNFKWNDENIPLVTPEYFVYDNSNNSAWNTLQKTNSYPTPKNNNACTVVQGEDDFTTYNNRTFPGYFNHAQGSITPKKDQSLDAWYDIGLRCVMFNKGIPYSSPNFQKAFYVWYIKGDGTDYPYTNHVGHIYPGQEVNFKYKYESLDKVLVKSANIIKIKGDTPEFKYGNAEDGFYARLSKPSQHCNCIAKVDMGLIETLGQRWHYQGFTLKSYPIFTKKPGDLTLNMRGDLTTLDITNLIDVSLTWEFDVFSITSSDENICKVEHDWKGNKDDPTFVAGPTYIKLIGDMNVLDQTVTITVKATPIGTKYTEQFTFNVRVKQLYNKQTTLKVNPPNLVTKVGTDAKYEVTTDANTYSVTTDNTSLIRLYKGKITGVKQGNGILTFKAQAPMSMPAIVKVPYVVNKYIPDPKIEPAVVSINVNVAETVDLQFTTNVPRANVSYKIANEKLAKGADIAWEDKITNDDPLTKEYPTRYGYVTLAGVGEGITEITFTAFIANGEMAVNKKVTIVVSPEVPKEPTEPDEVEDDGKIKTMTKADAYLSFHHQHQGVFTYLRSKGRTELKPEEIPPLVNAFKANKIFVMPKVTAEDMKKYDKTDFTLALVEDLNDNLIGTTQDTNPNYLDYKEPSNPMWGYQGNTTKDINTYLNSTTFEKFVTKKVNDNIMWVGDKGTYVNDVEYPFPGEKGFGVGPAPEDISTYYGMEPLPGCWDRNSDNYGNYKDSYGSIYVYIPRHYVKYNHLVKGGTKLLHSIDVYYPITMSSINKDKFKIYTGRIEETEFRGKEGVITNKSANYVNLINTLIMPRAFINNGKLLPGVFVSKYTNSSSTQILNGSYLKGSNPNLPTTRATARFTKAINYTNGSTFTLATGANLWCGEFNSKSPTGSTTGINITKSNRALEDTSFNTIYIRNMIVTLGLAHASRCLHYNTISNCDWLNNDTAMPKGSVNTDLYYKDNIERYNANLLAGIKDEDLGRTTHNGQKNGIHGLNNGTLEATIGALLKVTVTAANGRATGYQVGLDCAPKNTDFILLSNKIVQQVAASATGTGTLQTNGKVFDSISGSIIPSSVVNKGLLGIFNKVPLRVTNSYVPSGTLDSIYTNVATAKVHDDTVVDYYKFHMGLLGNYTEANNNPTRTDYETHSYNKSNSLDWNMDSINIGDNRTGFLISSTGRHEPADANSNFTYYMTPLHGGVLGYDLDNQGYIKIHNQHWMSLTWYRVGIKASDYGLNKNIYNKIASRFVVLPDLDKISTYVTSGQYEAEFNGKKTINPNISNVPNSKVNKTVNVWEDKQD